MSWSETPKVFRRLGLLAALALGPLALGGCGFTPVYGSRGAATAPVQQLAQVQIDPIPERTGQVLRNKLIDRFYESGRPGNADYRLVVNLSAAEEGLGIRRDATATRARLTVQANYELIEAKTGKVAYRTFSRAVVSYNLLEAQYATLVAQQDAYERALTELADDVRTRLALFFMRDPGSQPS